MNVGSLSMSSSPSNSNSNNDDFEIVERDPTGRYVRYGKILGQGTLKTVYKAFDEDDGKEVAWCKVEISEEIIKSQKQLQRLYSEANLLKTLRHENVVRCYHSWVDSNNKSFDMITELLISGNLRQYRKKHGLLLDNKAIKNWTRQILKGLDYLHSHNPPIVHRDLKCENIFVNGNSGKVKIGDLGLATVLEHPTARSVLGTPEFMAPELYEEEYNQLVDIYAFGMCMLQMVTNELPYSECKTAAQIYKKVTSGKKPAALDRVTDPQIRDFIDKCLAPVSERLAASELLKHTFLDSGVATSSAAPVTKASESFAAPVTEAVKVSVTEMHVLKLTGKKVDEDSIGMTLWIAKQEGSAEKVEFVFSLQNDTVFLVIEEMAKDLKLSTDDAAMVAELMEDLIAEVVPDLSCSPQICSVAEDDIYPQNVPEEKPASEEQDAEQALQYEISGDQYDPAKRDTNSSAYNYNDVSFNQEQNQAHSSVECQNNASRKGEENGHKKPTSKKLSTWLKKQLVRCRNRF